MSEHQSIDAIFCAAIEIESADQRQSYLAEACGADPELRRQLDRLLDAHFRGGSIVDSPAHGIDATVDQTPSECSGTQIGPYKLLQQIGEGGMGTVFMAEQTHPVQRKVALKVIKPGMDSRQIIARFEAERQALALMDHVNIARVLDAGATDAGRPYFVMELVHGVPITKYCDEHHLTPRQRLELFVPVCQAIQHAHQKGIIHRDIKPSNVLITLYDGQPVPKVIDFGVAKAIEQKLTERTLFTQYGTMVGTLEYMSPEQAELSALGVDTRSDIYSLGVLLYELLTGSTPLSHQRVNEAAFAEILRLIKEEEPPRPSTRLSDSGEALASISALRHMEPAKLTKLMRGELDWIVMKPLEKDRSRRYETASGFAADVQRYLNDEPVLACPPSVWYSTSKFVRRNKQALVTTGVLAVVLLVAVGAVAASIGWALSDRASRQAAVEKEAELALGEAERWAEQEKWDEAFDAVKRGGGLLAGGDSGQISGRLQDFRKDIEMLMWLDDVRLLVVDLQAGWHEWNAVHDGYAKAFADYGIDILNLPIAEAADRLRARDRLAVPLAVTLDVWAATPSSKTSAIRTQIRAVAAQVDPDPWRRKVREAVERQDGATLAELAGAPDLTRQSRNSLVVLEQGLKHCGCPREALDVLLKTQQLYPADFWANYWLAHELYWARRPNHDEVLSFARAAVGVRPKYAAAHLLLALSLQRKGRYGEAMVYHDRAIELAPNNPYAHHDRGWTLNLLGKHDEAIACYRKAIELWPEDPHAYGMIGNTLMTLNKPDEAIEAFRMSAKFNPHAPHAHNQLGAALRNQSRFDEALDAYSRTIAIKPDDEGGWSGRAFVHFRQQQFDRAVADFSQAVKLDPEVHTNWWHRGHAHLQLHQWDEAARDFGTVVEKWPHESEGWYRRATARAQLNQLDLALTDLRQAVENGFDNLEMLKSDPLLAPLRTSVEFGKLLEWLEWKIAARLDEAIALCRKATERAPDDAQAHHRLGDLLYKHGKYEQAALAYRDVVRLKPEDGEAQKILGHTLFHQQKWSEAEVAYQQAIRFRPDDADLRSRLGTVLVQQNKLVEAEAVWREAIRRQPDHVGAHVGINNLAWFLATSADPKVRDPKRAVELAEIAVARVPNVAWNTLGVAQYRAGDWQAATASFEKSMAVSAEGYAIDCLFLAMAHWKLEHQEEARPWYDRAAAWMEKNDSQNEELRRFRAEAEELLGIKPNGE
jgi:serine/threonine protein kinase/Flp pilus assembly protein TadD